MAKVKGPDLWELAQDGRRLMQEGKPEKAREIFIRVLEELPDARTRARLGYRRDKSQLFLRSLEGHQEPLSQSENLGLETRLALADCCYKCGLAEESVKHLERAVEVCPNRAATFCKLGSAYSRVGCQELAISALRRALRLDPEELKAHQSLAEHFVKLSRLRDAQKALRNAIRVDPECLDNYLGLAACYVQQGQIGKAEWLLYKTLDRFPRAVSLREMLADLCLRTGDFRGVIAHAKGLLRLNQRNAHAYDLLSLAQFQMGDFAAAINSLVSLVRLDPKDALSRLKLALLLQQNGDLGAAAEEYHKVVQMAPNSEWAKSATEAIENLDNYQMQQIVLRAAEDKYFRSFLNIDAEATVVAHGYRLSENALDLLRSMDFEAAPSSEGIPITYH